MTPERRKYKRCPIDPDKVQAIVSSSSKTYCIKDISRGGVKIEYSSLAIGPVETEMIDIIAVNYGGVYLPKIPCQTVYDIPTLMQGRSFKGGEMRNRGWKFLSLTREQEEGLDALITEL